MRRFAIVLMVSLWVSAGFGVSAQAISQGYETDDTLLVPGMVVSLVADDKGGKSKVERAVQTDGPNRVIGIASDTDESLVTAASSSSQAFVENEGEVRAFASNINGDIKKGDLLTLSPLRGILMRADAKTDLIIAIAAEDFIDSQADSYIVKGDGDGKALIDRIKVNLDYKGTAVQQSGVDSTLKKLGTTIAGKDVGIIRPLVALVIFLLIMIVEGSILYGAISSSITSVGRNPLARQIIFKELLRVMLIVLAVLFVGLASIYAVLLA